nr:hypothetical protein BaRGS_000081 [Batillaria attramentaria]
MFLDADADNDTVLHKDELVAVFTKYDANNDGRVSRHEYSNYLQAHEPELVTLGHFLYDEYDADGDHHLEQHDFDIFYQKMDLDGDDSVSEVDFRNYWTINKNKIKSKHKTNKNKNE